MTVDELNKYLQENSDVAEKFKAALKEALKDAKSQEEYPAIMAKVAADLGIDLSAEEISKKVSAGEIQKLSDDDLENVAGGFLLFFPWWS